jgi:hypothetical protein
MFVTGLYILYVLWTKWAVVLAEFHFGSVQYIPNRNSACLSQVSRCYLWSCFGILSPCDSRLLFPISPIPRDYMALTRPLPTYLEREYGCTKLFPNFGNPVHFHMVQNLQNKININNDFILSSSLALARWWGVLWKSHLHPCFSFHSHYCLLFP